MISNALSYLQASLAAAAGQAVTYLAGTSEIEIPDAVRGKSVYEVTDGTGHTVRAAMTDWLIAPSRLTIDDEPYEPEVGDRIVAADGTTYEVQKIGSEDCWRWSGPSKDRMRIHTREIPTS